MYRAASYWLINLTFSKLHKLESHQTCLDLRDNASLAFTQHCSQSCTWIYTGLPSHITFLSFVFIYILVWYSSLLNIGKASFGKTQRLILIRTRFPKLTNLPRGCNFVEKPLEPPSLGANASRQGYVWSTCILVTHKFSIMHSISYIQVYSPTQDGGWSLLPLNVFATTDCLLCITIMPLIQRLSFMRFMTYI